MNLVLGVLLAGVRCLVNRHQAHKPHQSANPVAAAFVALTLHIPCHLPRPIPRCVQKLLVDDHHEFQILGAFTLRLIIQVRPRQQQQPALPPYAQIMIPAHHFLPRVPSN